MKPTRPDRVSETAETARHVFANCVSEVWPLDGEDGLGEFAENGIFTCGDELVSRLRVAGWLTRGEDIEGTLA